jgi:hypothetical protein
MAAESFAAAHVPQPVENVHVRKSKGNVPACPVTCILICRGFLWEGLFVVTRYSVLERLAASQYGQFV